MEGLFRGHDGLALRHRHHQIAHLLSKLPSRIRRPLASGGSSVHSVHGAVHPGDGPRHVAMRQTDDDRSPKTATARKAITNVFGSTAPCVPRTP
jgi:hypothetical protein